MPSASGSKSIEGVRFFDQAELMQSAYGGFRTRTLELVMLGLFVVLAMVFVRYRKTRSRDGRVPPGVHRRRRDARACSGWIGVPTPTCCTWWRSCSC